MSSVDKSPSSKSLLSVQNIVLAQIIWAVAALLFFALFGITAKGESHPLWYSIGTSIFEATAYLVAALLCFRNWGSSQIVSGRNVWLGIGLGMLFYFLGNIVFSYWELVLGLEPAVSPGDFFFILTYIFLLWGMVQAVFTRRLNLELWQKGVVVGIAVVGIAIAIALASKPAETTATQLLATPAAYAQSPQPAQTTAPAAPAPAADDDQKPQPPEWALNLEQQLKPLEGPVTLFYLVCDTLLLVFATTLLLAFWGGRFSQSWRMIAIAAFFLYLGDVWFKYATRDPNYQSGSLPEVAWVFSGVLFGIGAALEYDLSSRSRRASSRRR
ncbi:MAG: hypothetical protein IGS48_18820 [Oscillatoriales cyanobacterium C42_A2020_001]|nr:hypothetical protein [Leptolyngbyaceae cyanobacterium C42_A2020_001]